MRIANRLRRIETALTPQQAVLLWLAEAQRDDFGTLVQKINRAPRETHPRVRLPEMVAKSVRERLDLKIMTPLEVECAEREARRQTDLLIVLAGNLFSCLNLECLLALLSIVVLGQSFWALQVDVGAPPPPAGWDAWRDLLTETLIHVWRIEDATAEILDNYFGGHAILPAGMQDRLYQCVKEAEELAHRYNALEGKVAGWTAFDLAGLRCSVHIEGTLLVEALSGRAEDEVQKALGPPIATPWSFGQFRPTQRTR